MTNVGSMWFDEQASIFGPQTSTATSISQYHYGSNTSTTTATSQYFQLWVNNAQQQRQNQILAAWTDEIQLGQSIQIHSSDEVVNVQWETIYGQHMAESVERVRAREALLRQDGAQRQRIETQAVERATRLLLEHLTPQQRADYTRSKWFMVDGKSGRRYRVREGAVANVDLMLPDGRVEARLCAVLYNVPLPDQLLSQKLHLELAEKDFLAVAIRHAA